MHNLFLWSLAQLISFSFQTLHFQLCLLLTITGFNTSCPFPPFTEQIPCVTVSSPLWTKASPVPFNPDTFWLVAGHANQEQVLLALIMAVDMKLKVRIYLKCLGTSRHSFSPLFASKQSTAVDLYFINTSAYSGFCLRGDGNWISAYRANCRMYPLLYHWHLWANSCFLKVILFMCPGKLTVNCYQSLKSVSGIKFLLTLPI